MDTAKTSKTPTEPRQCGYCGNTFQPTRKWSNYCSKDCRQKFHNRNVAMGGVLTALVTAWIATRHAKPGTEEAAVCNYARRELTAIASTFNEESKEAGRPGAVPYVAAMMRSGSLYVDRKRK